MIPARIMCDSSVLVPAVLAWHPEHDAARAALAEVDALPAHVLLETFSVLTRLPAPHRIGARDAAAVLGAMTLPLLQLPGLEYAALVAAAGAKGVRGGALYDALIAVTAAHHGAELITRDARAQPTYEAMGTQYRLLT